MKKILATMIGVLILGCGQNENSNSSSSKTAPTVGAGQSSNINCKLTKPVPFKDTGRWVYRNIKTSPELTKFDEGDPVVGGLTLFLFRIRYEDYPTSFLGFSVYDEISNLDHRLGFFQGYLGSFNVSGEETLKNGIKTIFTESTQEIGNAELNFTLTEKDGLITSIYFNAPFKENEKWITKSFCVTEMDAPTESN